MSGVLPLLAGLGYTKPPVTTYGCGADQHHHPSKVKQAMDLGPEASFTKFPAPISVGELSYYLVRNKRGYLLLSTICPHQGGEVVPWDSCFMCPDHGWRFDLADGECINGPNARLTAFPVTVRSGHLFAEIPVDA